LTRRSVFNGEEEIRIITNSFLVPKESWEIKVPKIMPRIMPSLKALETLLVNKNNTGTPNSRKLERIRSFPIGFV